MNRHRPAGGIKCLKLPLSVCVLVCSHGSVASMHFPTTRILCQKTSKPQHHCYNDVVASQVVWRRGEIVPPRGSGLKPTSGCGVAAAPQSRLVIERRGLAAVVE